MSTSTEGELPGWYPGEFALELGRWPDPDDASPTTILLQHPSAPFVRWLDTGNEAELRAFAHAYLVQANDLAQLGLPVWWLDALHPDAAHPRFGWLAIDRPSDDERPDPRASFWFERRSEGETIDGTLILLAGELFKGQILGSEFGIRVVAHARRRGEEDEVRITGMSASLPFGPYRSEGSDPEVGELAIDLEDFLRRMAGLVALPLSLQEDSVFFRGFRLGRNEEGTAQGELRGRGLAITDERYRAQATPYEFFATGTASGDGSMQMTSLRKTPLTASARGDARVFPRDPASRVGPQDTGKRRPMRPERARDPAASLDTYRVPENIARPQGYKDLEIIGRLQVLKSWYVLDDHTAPLPGPLPAIKRVRLPGPGPAIRSNDFSALNAYRNLGELFERFALYGIPLGAYFRIASLPVRAVYRSGVRPGPGKDGQTINASVQPEGWPPGFPGPTHPGTRPILRVHLALGDLTRRARKGWDPKPPWTPKKNRSPAEPLGIAGDSRWVWHEIGHILLMASVGDLEFHFAHSAGDALAAIVHDPLSDLATDRNWRGWTFPWVFMPRRHDRCVHHGWSWSGSLHRALAQALASLPESERLRLKGYWSEQILSSSLFRLYRCLGGDTVEVPAGDPDRIVRQSAAHYAVFLIMKGIGLLGHALIAPADQPEQFVAALIDADIATQTFTVPVSDNGAMVNTSRTGGCARKAIRWAFEAQGMYAGGGAINNAPGLPPPVDIYIADRRPTAETIRRCAVRYGAGSYVPVSLDWGRYANAPGVAGPGIPAWFARSAAMRLRAGQIFVRVGNRGAQTALGVTVSLWWHAWPAGNDPPLWNTPQWATIGAQPAAQDVPSGQTRTFGGFALAPAPGRYLVFAQATCADDRANPDPATGYACSLLPTPLPDLVANDNNLGLTVISLP
jgi:hypothetical protein